jgi:hypothetical protein
MSCCEKWAKATGEVQSAGPSALLYPNRSDAQINEQSDGTFSVVGCCLNCYVLHDLVFCPWCGKRVAA